MNMTTEQLTLLLGMMIQTAALFFWGGQVHQMLRDHDRRLTRLEVLREKGES